MAEEDPGRAQNSCFRASPPEPLPSDLPSLYQADWVAKVLRWFDVEFTAKLAGDEQDSQSDGIEAPCRLSQDFRDKLLPLLRVAADVVIKLKSALSWKSPDDATRLAMDLRTIEAEIESVDELRQEHGKNLLCEVRRVRLELADVIARPAKGEGPGTGPSRGVSPAVLDAKPKPRPKRGRPPRSKPDKLDGVVRTIIQNGDAAPGYIPVKNLMQKHKPRIPSGTKPEALRSRIRRALNRAAHNEAVEK